jgi:hypothetical protein
MSEENKEQLLPEENNEKNVDNQEVNAGDLQNLTFEEHQLLESGDAHEEKSGDQIVEEIDDHLAKQEEEQEEKIDLDVSRLKNFSLKELTDEFRDLMDKYPVQHIKHYLYLIKDIFNDKLFALKEEALQKYIEQTGSDK